MKMKMMKISQRNFDKMKVDEERKFYEETGRKIKFNFSKEEYDDFYKLLKG